MPKYFKSIDQICNTINNKITGKVLLKQIIFKTVCQLQIVKAMLINSNFKMTQAFDFININGKEFHNNIYKHKRTFDERISLHE